MFEKHTRLELFCAKVPLDELAMHQSGFLTKSCRHVTVSELLKNHILGEPASQVNGRHFSICVKNV